MQNNLIPIIFFILLITATIVIFKKKKRTRQLGFIKSYLFHKSIKNKIYNKHPQLTPDESHLVFRALRDYFWMCNKANRNMVAMPSQIVDEAWHEFILFTRNYEQFCSKALGRFLHHTPTEAMSSPTLAQSGIKRAWRLACAKENIDPNNPKKLPLIFSIDSMLNIPGGFNYSLDCLANKQNSTNSSTGNYCAGHINCASGCAGDSGVINDSDGGFFDGMFDSSGSDCGGGCGGD